MGFVFENNLSKINSLVGTAGPVSQFLQISLNITRKQPIREARLNDNDQRRVIPAFPNVLRFKKDDSNGFSRSFLGKN